MQLGQGVERHCRCLIRKFLILTAARVRNHKNSTITKRGQRETPTSNMIEAKYVFKNIIAIA
ncbi:MAG: hypothetical protein AAGA16_12255 [Cyanobacteria bacterium P01_E01_bin.35]